MQRSYSYGHHFYLRERYFGQPNIFRNIAHRRGPQPESVHLPTDAMRNRRNVSHLPTDAMRNRRNVSHLSTDAMRNRRNVSHRNDSNSAQHSRTFQQSSTIPERLPPRAQNLHIRTQLDDANLERTVRLLVNNDFARRSLQAERWEERWLDIHNDIRRLDPFSTPYFNYGAGSGMTPKFPSQNFGGRVGPDFFCSS